METPTTGDVVVPAKPRIGRPPGSTNLIAYELKAFWHRWFSSELYRESAKTRILNGTAPHLEKYLLERIYGKAVERIEVVQHEDVEDIASMSVEQLTKRAAELVDRLREAQDMQSALPAEFSSVDLKPLDPPSPEAGNPPDAEPPVMDHASD